MATVDVRLPPVKLAGRGRVEQLHGAASAAGDGDSAGAAVHGHSVRLADGRHPDGLSGGTRAEVESDQLVSAAGASGGGGPSAGAHPSMINTTTTIVARPTRRSLRDPARRRGLTGRLVPG